MMLGIQSGMGDFSSDITSAWNAGGTWLDSSTIVSGVPNYVFAFGGAAAIMALALFMPSGSEYRKRSAQLRSQYRGYRRIAKAAGSSLQRV